MAPQQQVMRPKGHKRAKGAKKADRTMINGPLETDLTGENQAVLHTDLVKEKDVDRLERNHNELGSHRNNTDRAGRKMHMDSKNSITASEEQES
jgi:hypothetical protein